MNSDVQCSRYFILTAATFAALFVTTTIEGAAQSRSTLGGSWSGGGVLITPSGDRERANCRATFRNQGGSSYSMSAVCATPSARVAQSAQIARTGGNHFSGSFFNAEYNISGSISLRVNGNRLSAHLSGGGASASLSLSRR